MESDPSRQEIGRSSKSPILDRLAHAADDRRRFGIPLAVTLLIAALGVGVLTAHAASQNVTATASNQFMPPTVTINQGESVTWQNSGGGDHNVVFDDGSYTNGPPSSADWTATRTFNAPGTFTYHCQVHQAEGMKGTVVVQSTGMTDTGTVPGGGGTGGSNAPPDTIAPTLTLGGSRTQRVLRHRGVIVFARSSESGTATAGGTVAVPRTSRVFRFRRVIRSVLAGQRVKLKLALSRNALAAINRALSSGLRLTARLTVTARDRTGNSRSVRRKIRLVR